MMSRRMKAIVRREDGAWWVRVEGRRIAGPYDSVSDALDWTSALLERGVLHDVEVETR